MRGEVCLRCSFVSRDRIDHRAARRAGFAAAQAAIATAFGLVSPFCVRDLLDHHKSAFDSVTPVTSAEIAWSVGGHPPPAGAISSVAPTRAPLRARIRLFNAN